MNGRSANWGSAWRYRLIKVLPVLRCDDCAVLSTPYVATLPGELAAQHRIDLAGVRLAFRCLHYMSDQCVERFLLASAKLGDDRRLRGDHGIDQRFDCARVGNLAQSAPVDDRIDNFGTGCAGDRTVARPQF